MHAMIELITSETNKLMTERNQVWLYDSNNDNEPFAKHYKTNLPCPVPFHFLHTAMNHAK